MLIPFDVMGKMGYSVEFGSVKAGKPRRECDLMDTLFGAVANLGMTSWSLALGKDLNLGREGAEFEDLAAKLVDERVKVGKASRLHGCQITEVMTKHVLQQNEVEGLEDIVKYFLEDFRSDKSKSFVNRDVLYSDSQVIMIGGTDTIAATLSWIFYYVARDASLRERLRKDLAPRFGKTIPGEFVQSDLIDSDSWRLLSTS